MKNKRIQCSGVEAGVEWQTIEWQPLTMVDRVLWLSRTCHPSGGEPKGLARIPIRTPHTHIYAHLTTYNETITITPSLYFHCWYWFYYTHHPHYGHNYYYYTQKKKKKIIIIYGISITTVIIIHVIIFTIISINSTLITVITIIIKITIIITIIIRFN